MSDRMFPPSQSLLVADKQGTSNGHSRDRRRIQKAKETGSLWGSMCTAPKRAPAPPQPLAPVTERGPTEWERQWEKADSNHGARGDVEQDRRDAAPHPQRRPVHERMSGGRDRKRVYNELDHPAGRPVAMTKDQIQKETDILLKIEIANCGEAVLPSIIARLVTLDKEYDRMSTNQEDLLEKMRTIFDQELGETRACLNMLERVVEGSPVGVPGGPTDRQRTMVHELRMMILRKSQEEAARKGKEKDVPAESDNTALDGHGSVAGPSTGSLPVAPASGPVIPPGPGRLPPTSILPPGIATPVVSSSVHPTGVPSDIFPASSTVPTSSITASASCSAPLSVIPPVSITSSGPPSHPYANGQGPLLFNPMMPPPNLHLQPPAFGLDKPPASTHSTGPVHPAIDFSKPPPGLGVSSGGVQPSSIPPPRFGTNMPPSVGAMSGIYSNPSDHLRDIDMRANSPLATLRVGSGPTPLLRAPPQVVPNGLDGPWRVSAPNLRSPPGPSGAGFLTTGPPPPIRGPRPLVPFVNRPPHGMGFGRGMHRAAHMGPVGGTLMASLGIGASGTLSEDGKGTPPPVTPRKRPLDAGW